MAKKTDKFTIKKCRRCGSEWTDQAVCPSCGNTNRKDRTTDKNEYNKRVYRNGKPHKDREH